MLEFPDELRSYKDQFSSLMREFVTSLADYIATDDGQWKVKGFIDVQRNIYTISSDTKIISKILEIHLFPRIKQFAFENGYDIILADQQNYYPDLSFVRRDNTVSNLPLI